MGQYYARAESEDEEVSKRDLGYRELQEWAKEHGYRANEAEVTLRHLHGLWPMVEPAHYTKEKRKELGYLEDRTPNVVIGEFLDHLKILEENNDEPYYFYKCDEVPDMLVLTSRRSVAKVLFNNTNVEDIEDELSPHLEKDLNLDQLVERLTQHVEVEKYAGEENLHLFEIWTVKRLHNEY